MIEENAPTKLREIIMDTWPQLFWLKEIKNDKEKNNGSINTTTTKEGMV